MLILLGFAKGVVSPTEVIPLLWYQMLLLVITVLYMIFPKISDKVLANLDKKNK